MIRNSNLPPSGPQFNVNSRQRLGSLERTTPNPPPAVEWEVTAPSAAASATGDTTNPYPIMDPSVLVMATMEISAAIASDIVIHLLKDGETFTGNEVTMPAGSTRVSQSVLQDFSQGTCNSVSATVNDDGGGGYGPWCLKMLFRS